MWDGGCVHSLSRLSGLITWPLGIRVRSDGDWMGLVRSEARIDVRGSRGHVCGVGYGPIRSSPELGLS